jgi:hypothetical protein
MEKEKNNIALIKDIVDIRAKKTFFFEARRPEACFHPPLCSLFVVATENISSQSIVLSLNFEPKRVWWEDGPPGE